MLPKKVTVIWNRGPLIPKGSEWYQIGPKCPIFGSNLIFLQKIYDDLRISKCQNFTPNRRMKNMSKMYQAMSIKDVRRFFDLLEIPTCLHCKCLLGFSTKGNAMPFFIDIAEKTYGHLVNICRASPIFSLFCQLPSYFCWDTYLAQDWTYFMDVPKSALK